MGSQLLRSQGNRGRAVTCKGSHAHGEGERLGIATHHRPFWVFSVHGFLEVTCSPRKRKTSSRWFKDREVLGSRVSIWVTHVRVFQLLLWRQSLLHFWLCGFQVASQGAGKEDVRAVCVNPSAPRAMVGFLLQSPAQPPFLLFLCSLQAVGRQETLAAWQGVRTPFLLLHLVPSLRVGQHPGQPMWASLSGAPVVKRAWVCGDPPHPRSQGRMGPSPLSPLNSGRRQPSGTGGRLWEEEAGEANGGWGFLSYLENKQEETC